MNYIYLILVLVIIILGVWVWRLVAKRKAGGKEGLGIVGEEMKNKEANKRRILKFMEEKALIADQDQLRIVNNDVEKLLGVSNATAERYLHELEKEGVLKQMGITGQGVYYVKI